jgi:hypothetical protein
LVIGARAGGRVPPAIFGGSIMAVKVNAKKLTKREMGVAVAKDVLEQLRLSRLDVRCGMYMGGRYDSRSGPVAKKISERMIKSPACDLKDVVDLAASSCRVCAKGAAVLSMARLFDNLPATLFFRSDGYPLGNNPWKELEAVFSWETIQLIEAAFEKSEAFACRDTSPTLALAAVNFGRRYESPEDRLWAIMLNVVKNRGEFRPDR